MRVVFLLLLVLFFRWVVRVVCKPFDSHHVAMMIAHELGHLIGLWHEQARLDRDYYVTIHWENIDDAHYHNFNRRIGVGQNQGPYDYDSIIHYSEMAFSKNGKPTVAPRRQGVQIGQRTHLSAGDITSVNALYAKIANEEQ